MQRIHALVRTTQASRHRFLHSPTIIETLEVWAQKEQRGNLVVCKVPALNLKRAIIGYDTSTSSHNETITLQSNALHSSSFGEIVSFSVSRWGGGREKRRRRALSRSMHLLLILSSSLSLRSTTALLFLLFFIFVVFLFVVEADNCIYCSEKKIFILGLPVTNLLERSVTVFIVTTPANSYVRIEFSISIALTRI